MSIGGKEKGGWGNGAFLQATFVFYCYFKSVLKNKLIKKEWNKMK